MENSVIKAIETRRSVRSFSQKAIPEELLDAVLKAGTYAPTGGGRQSPVIVAVKDAAYRDKIARLNAEVMGKDTDPYYGAPVIILVLFSTHITTDLMRIADDIVYISQGRILVACPLKDLLGKYRLARFSSLKDATTAKAIGVKAVKEGYEGLLPCDMQIATSATATDATIDNIIVHLEKANEEEKHAEFN